MLRVLGKFASINVRKVLWACDEIGIPYRREDWGSGFRPTSDPEFLALNPKALVPVVVDGDLTLTESNTILRYLAAKHQRADLLPVTPAERAHVEQWMDWQATEFNSSWRYAFLAIVRKNPAFSDPALVEQSRREWTSMMALLDGRLSKTRRFVCGDGFTLADIVVGLGVNRWFQTPMERRTFPAVSQYWELIRQRPCASHYVGGATD
jgi:glutathione S-transferase